MKSSMGWPGISEQFDALVSPKLSAATGSAPAWSSVAAMSGTPFQYAARCNGLPPDRSLAFTAAPPAISAQRNAASVCQVAA